MLGLTFEDPSQYDTSEARTAPAPNEENQDAHGQEDQSGNFSEADLQSVITGLQSHVRGQQARSHVSVSSVGDSGIVHVQIKGDAGTFEKVGIDNMNTSNGPKELHYLSVPSQGFQPHAVGGDKPYFDKDMQGGVPDEYSQQSLVSNSAPGSSSHAFINGGYFNVAGRANKNLPEHAPIGETATPSGNGESDTPGGKKIEHIPHPAEYEDDYRTITFKDGSKLTTAPILSDHGGRAAFPQEKLLDPKYRYQGRDKDKPGVLKHAQHPNPRSGVSFPGAISSENAYRLAAGFTPPGQQRGSASSGFTMPEWSTAMARMDRLNQNPGGSLNLDGGGSAALGVVNSEGEKLFDKRQNNEQAASTLLSLSSDPETT